MENYLSYTKGASEFLKNASFNKFWKENQDLEPSDQVINAWQAGKSENIRINEKQIIDKFLLESQERRKNDTLEFINAATENIISLYGDLKKEVPSLSLHLKVESIESVEFLFSISDEAYFLENLETLYAKAATIQESSSSNKTVSIRFTTVSKDFDSRILSDDGFIFTFQGE